MGEIGSWSLALLLVSLSPVLAVEPTLTITRTYPPRVKERMIYATIDQDITMSCFGENVNTQEDEQQVQWMRTREVSNLDPQNPGMETQVQHISSNEAITDNTKFSLEKPTDYTWRLRIKNAGVTDTGNYTCFVKLTNYNRKEANITVVVQIPPRLDPIRTSADTVVTAGDTVALYCNGTGLPQPTVRWTRAGNALLPIGKEEHNEELLLLANIKPADRGRYRCELINEVGVATRDIRIGVRFPPQIEVQYPTVYQKVGYRMELQCFVESNPLPNTDVDAGWIFGSTTYTTSSDSYEVRAVAGAFNRLTYELIFHSVSKEDFGTYRCRMRNNMGTVYGTVVLAESDTPQPSKKLGRIISGSESLIVSSFIVASITIFSMFVIVLQ